MVNNLCFKYANQFEAPTSHPQKNPRAFATFKSWLVQISWNFWPLRKYRPLTKNNVSRYIGCTAFVHSLFNSSSFSADNNYFKKKARLPTVTFHVYWPANDYSSFKTKKIIQLEYTLIFKHTFEKCCKAFAALCSSPFKATSFPQTSPYLFSQPHVNVFRWNFRFKFPTLPRQGSNSPSTWVGEQTTSKCPWLTRGECWSFELIGA